MLPARSRMRLRRDFDAAVRAGRRAGRPRLVAHLRIDAATGGCPRVGFVVSRAVGNAPCRNRVRRRLRHLVRDRVQSLPRGTLLVVRANPAAARATYAELAADLDTVLERLAGAHDHDR
ncbi:MAG: ribonuclease P protein component [Streptosporangiales bacterium]